MITHPRISDELVNAFSNGTYDAADRYLITRYVRAGDFVLELGAGCGLTAMTAKRVVGESGIVTTVEPDAEMCSVARHNFELNGLDIGLYHGAAVPSAEIKEIKFYKKRNFSASSVINYGTDSAPPYVAPAIYPPKLCATQEGRRGVLICDVEGLETRLLSNPEILAPFTVLIFELHNFGLQQRANPTEIGPMVEALHRAGFRARESISHSWVWVR